MQHILRGRRRGRANFVCFASLAACIYCRLAVALPPSHFCCRHGALCTACASLAIGRRSSVDFGRLSPPVRIYPQGAGPLRFLKLRGGQETDKESSIVAEFDDDSLRAEDGWPAREITEMTEAAEALAVAAIEDNASPHFRPTAGRKSFVNEGKFSEGEASTRPTSSPAIPLTYRAEWSHQNDRTSHERSRRALFLISWWYLLNFLGVIRTCLTIMVMLAAPVVMQAALQNPSFWIGLVFSSRARRIRTLLFRAAAAAHYASLLFVARRLVHYIMAGLIMPGCWLLGDAASKEPIWMASSMKTFRRTLLNRCADGRKWMESELQGQEIMITAADGGHFSAMLLQPTSRPHQKAPDEGPEAARSPTSRAAGFANVHHGGGEVIAKRAATMTRPRAWRTQPSMPTVVRFNGNSEAWELADRRLVESYLEGGFQLLLCNYRAQEIRQLGVSEAGAPNLGAVGARGPVQGKKSLRINNVRPSRKPSEDSITRDASPTDAAFEAVGAAEGPLSGGAADGARHAGRQGKLFILVDWMWRANQVAFEAVSPSVLLGLLLRVRLLPLHFLRLVALLAGLPSRCISVFVDTASGTGASGLHSRELPAGPGIIRLDNHAQHKQQALVRRLHEIADLVCHIPVGTTTRRDALLLDAEAAVKYALSSQGLNVKRKHLVVVGHSIGGAVGAIIASRFQVSVCSSRSFAKLSQVVGMHGAAMMNILPLPLPWPSSIIPRALCGLLCLMSGWELDAIGAWSQIKRFKWSECCTADKIIPFPLSLHLAVMRARAKEGIRRKKAANLMLKPVQKADNHNRPYRAEEMEEHLGLLCEAVRESSGKKRAHASARTDRMRH